VSEQSLFSRSHAPPVGRVPPVEKHCSTQGLSAVMTTEKTAGLESVSEPVQGQHDGRKSLHRDSILPNKNGIHSTAKLNRQSLHCRQDRSTLLSDTNYFFSLYRFLPFFLVPHNLILFFILCLPPLSCSLNLLPLSSYCFSALIFNFLFSFPPSCPSFLTSSSSHF
jgi:hypothetical protein